MSKVLVTGATGFLGRHVIQTLLDTDLSFLAPEDRVRILCRSDNPWPNNPRIECVRGDITDPDSVQKAVAGTEVVIHLAGIVRRKPEARQLMRQIHVEGTRNICEAALSAGRPRIIVSSSSGTVAVSRTPTVHIDSAPYAVDLIHNWPYYQTKMEQEKLAFSYHKDRQLDIVILNPSLLLGPGDIYGSSTNDVAAFLGRKIPNVPSGGFSFVDARDAAQAFVAAVNHGRSGQRYLIGGHNMAVRDFFGRLERISGVRGPKISLPEWLARGASGTARKLISWLGSEFPIDDATIEMAYRFWYCDSSLAERELHFHARPADTTIRDTIEFLSQQSRATEA